MLNRFHAQKQKIHRLVALRKKCLHAEKCMREKQLAMMRERNLYLQKCRQIEELGERVEWGGDNQEDEAYVAQDETDNVRLLQEVYDILYTEK